MIYVTFLGPVGATFSHDAYDMLAKTFDAPPIEKSFGNCIPAAKNAEVIKTILGHDGYGVLAMETKADGRVTEPLESFIRILGSYNDTDCPIKIIGGIGMKLHFALMARAGMNIGDVKQIVGHAKAFGPCARHIAALKVSTAQADSNGLAAQMVATKDEFAHAAALGPLSAAKTYGLNVLDDAFEDDTAVTTFFLIGPKAHASVLGEKNRALIVFETRDRPGSLVDALIPFKNEGINMRQIHSVHIENGTYRFAIEIECGSEKLASLQRAKDVFVRSVEKYIFFGPFAVIS
jgi:chorismate mutase/prephenate dehydratase